MFGDSEATARPQVFGSGAFCLQSRKRMVIEVQASIDLKQRSPVTTMTNLTDTLWNRGRTY